MSTRSTRKQSQVTQSVNRPQDKTHWGREGEKMNPNMPPQQGQGGQQPIFQHRGGQGLQVPYNQNPYGYGGYPPQQPLPPYGYPPQNGYNPYGYNGQPPPNYPQGLYVATLS